MRIIFYFIAFLSLFTAKAQVLLQETTVDTLTVITGLDIPWEIRYGPDNYLWVTERYGRVSRVNPETGAQDVVLDLSATVWQQAESGMLGMAMHPDFDNNPFVYLAYTYNASGNTLERIVRYTYTDGQLIDEMVLLDDINGNTTHNGCRMVITPDNKLLLTTGDAQDQPAAQDIGNLSGKVLRINLDGSIPEDNPFPGSPVYTVGHRNPQGLCYAPNGIVYSSEHGPSTDDEFNVIEPGRNYGWPDVHGFCDLPDEIPFCEANNVFEPLAAWTPTVAASDILYYDHPAIPEWEGRMLMTTLKNKRLYVLELDESGMAVLGEDQYFQNFWGRLRDVCMDPDGAIYLATNGPDWSNSQPFTHSIIKIWNPDYVFSAEESPEGRDAISIYPNPAQDQIRIDVSPQRVGERLRLFSPTGQLVLDQTIHTESTMLPLNRLGKGLYLVIIGDPGSRKEYNKIMIQ
jgi:glucose/arabinose dehydrogenase